MIYLKDLISRLFLPPVVLWLLLQILGSQSDWTDQCVVCSLVDARTITQYLYRNHLSQPLNS